MVSERIPVVLLPYRNTDQVRQLFADLNLNAKPVNKTIGYAFDSRDPIAQLAKKVCTVVTLFDGRVNKRTNSLPKSSANVITLNVLVEGTRSLLEGLSRGSGDSSIDPLTVGESELAWKLFDAWKLIVGAFPQWESVINGEVSPGQLREQYVFPHGLGWLTLTSLAGRLISTLGDDWSRIFLETVSRVDWSRSSSQLDGLAVISGRISNTKSTVASWVEWLLTIAQTLTEQPPAKPKFVTGKAV
jgi:hypothetical protein